MSARLFVGNLPFSATAEDLRNLFDAHGCSVSDAVVITDRATGRSRGFGFVSFETGEEAERATELVNGEQLGGRELRINEAEERPPRVPRPSRQYEDDGGDRRPREKRRRSKGRSRRRRDDEWADSW